MIRKISLQNKILIMFTAAILVTMSFIIYFDAYSLRLAVKETYVSQLKGITTAINGRYEESHSIDDVQQIFDYIKHKEPMVIRLSLHGNRESQPVVLASTERNRIEQPSPSFISPTLQSSKTLVSHLQSDFDGIPKVRLVAPLIEDGVTIGAIELLLNTSYDNELVQDRIELTVLVGISISLVLLGVLWFIIRKLLVLPLMTLREAAATVQAGKVYEKIKLDASQEINEVAAAFNDMVFNLEDRYQRSITDPLTGIYNSAYFKLKLTEALMQARSFGHPVALLFLDVDHFKNVNDNEGHIFGDEVLKEIAKVISDNVRSTDTVCRYGGEEFVIIMPYSDHADALSVAEQIRQMVAIHCSQSLLNPVTVSIGTAVFPEDAPEELLVHLADQAMYVAKSLGRNRVVSARDLHTYKKKEYEKRSEDGKWLLNTILSIARAVEVKDSYTHSHSEMVSRYASAIASMMGLPDEEVKRISIAGLLHDVGKIGIPDSILNKEGILTDEEYEIMKTHPVLGYNILACVDELRDILPYVLHHHERPDGKGYPDRLTSGEIPLGAKIIAVADAFHSMVSARPYRKNPLTPEEAAEELKRSRGTQFDAVSVDTFLLIMNKINDFPDVQLS